MQLKDYLNDHQFILDGSMGTYYCNLMNNAEALSEMANLSAPEVIEGIHREYITAGARIIRTNTFAANREVLQMSKSEQRKLIHTACRIAKKSVRNGEQADSKPVWIFGNIGPITENAKTDEDIILQEYQMMCDIFMDEGLNGIHFETFADAKYIEKLAPYIKEKKPDMFLLVSYCVNKNGYSQSGISAARLMERSGQLKEIDACGFNCGIGSGHMYSLLQQITFPVGKLSYASPNAGYPEQMQNRMAFMDNAQYFSENMKRIAELGLDLLGGCCGTTPEYIKNIVFQTENIKKPVITKSERTLQGEQKLPQRKNEFHERLQSGKKVIAVELDPPYNAEIDKLMECAHIVKNSGADIITFADSPMGRSRVDSILMSIKIADETGMIVMPHVCCRDRNMISMRSSLLGAYINGIRNLLIVTGDPVPGESRVSTTGVFDYNSIQLMDYVKEMNAEHFGMEPFSYGGALNYGRGSIEKVIERMKRKIDAGATYFLTQPIFSKEDAFRIKQIKESVDAKILCGILPLVSYRNACFIKNEIAGINVPDEIVERYHPDMSKEEAEKVGALMAREMMELLDPIADGYYFMLPFNRVSLLEKILNK
ncbi:MAG: Methionine synthase (cobalamin-dependent), methyltransferase domain [Herbinix sp.]|nr:Methionine synthase (cobalamin-dependent), methyltransferase domain [Herbinix sp.]